MDKLLTINGFFKVMFDGWSWFLIFWFRRKNDRKWGYGYCYNFFFRKMNFVEIKSEAASYDESFRRNLIEICERCILHFPDNIKFRQFLEEVYQIIFLKSDVLEENERNILKTLYKNNEKPFIVCYQLWLKFENELFYLENRTIKFVIVYEINKAQILLKEIKRLEIANSRVIVSSKSFS